MILYGGKLPSCEYFVLIFTKSVSIKCHCSHFPCINKKDVKVKYSLKAAAALLLSSGLVNITVSVTSSKQVPLFATGFMQGHSGKFPWRLNPSPPQEHQGVPNLTTNPWCMINDAASFRKNDVFLKNLVQNERWMLHVMINRNGGCVGIRGRHVNVALWQSDITVFSGDSQSTEQENRCGWAREGERGSHAETPGKLTGGWVCCFSPL